MKMTDKRSRSVFRLADRIERLAAKAKGKGYGTASIEKENELTHKLLKQRPTLAIDIGGNIGDYTAEIRRRTPDTEIHIFEPSVTNISRLRDRFSGDRNIRIAPFAVSDNAGAATLFANVAGSGLASLTQRRLDHFNIDFNVKESVQTIRFEDYWRDTLASRPIDIVKLDIEGHELSALNGFGQAIYSVAVLQFEFGGCNIDTRTFFQDFWYFFKELGFDIYRVTPIGLEYLERYRESDEYFSTTNYIAVNKAYSTTASEKK